MKESDRTHTPDASRRRFAQTVAAALVAAPLARVTAATAQAQPPAREPVAPPNPQPTPAASPQQPPRPSPLAEAYAEAARLRFGDKLDAEQLTRLKRDMEGNVRTAERLRAYKLKNADEPDFVFSA